MDVSVAAAKAAGAELLAKRGQVAVHAKAPRDLVTEADFAAQQIVFQRLRDAFPSHTIIGEEQLHDKPKRSDSCYRWVIDPLDGTTNYVHGLPFYCTSIALLENNQPIVGVVYNPENDECYSAMAGQGAYLNGALLKVSHVERLDAALVAASFAATVLQDAPEVQRFLTVLRQSRAIRRMGSAALNLCYVAASRLDGYFASTTKLWDVAAGILFIRQAGGVVTGINGQEFDAEHPHFVAASTPALHAQLVELM